MTSPSRLRALIAEARPRQWVKNGLVWSAPAAAGVLNEATALTRTAATFVAFCLVSSGTYFLNDLHDLDGDRAHPQKRMRPIASGRLSTRVGLIVGLALIVSGLGLALVIRWQLLLVVMIYVSLTLAYTLLLKQIPVVELVVVAAGFVLRAIAGGVALDIEVSQWFLIVTSFGSLFMVAGKRTATSWTG